jgi:hypothetical protein
MFSVFASIFFFVFLLAKEHTTCAPLCVQRASASPNPASHKAIVMTTVALFRKRNFRGWQGNVLFLWLIHSYLVGSNMHIPDEDISLFIRGSAIRDSGLLTMRNGS